MGKMERTARRKQTGWQLQRDNRDILSRETLNWRDSQDFGGSCSIWQLRGWNVKQTTKTEEEEEEEEMVLDLGRCLGQYLDALFHWNRILSSAQSLLFLILYLYFLWRPEEGTVCNYIGSSY